MQKRELRVLRAGGSSLTAGGLTAGGVAAIVLAAGRSRRMGRPKLLLPLDGRRTVVEVAVARLRPHVDSLVVVVGHLAGQVASVLAGQDVRLAINEDVDRGMLSSVQCGLRAAGAHHRGYLICLADQPAIGGPVVAALLQAATRSGRGIVIPTCGGKRGHPVYLSRSYLEEVLSLDPQCSLNAVTRAHPQDTCELPLDQDAIVEDMDTPVDYARERARAQAPAGPCPADLAAHPGAGD